MATEGEMDGTPDPRISTTEIQLLFRPLMTIHTHTTVFWSRDPGRKLCTEARRRRINWKNKRGINKMIRVAQR